MKYRIIVKGDCGDIIKNTNCDCGHDYCEEPVYGEPDDFLQYKDKYELEENEYTEYCDIDCCEKLESDVSYFCEENNKLMIVVEYTSNEKLTKKELKELMDYTQGQWSDGIGEGFEQQLHNNYYVSMWHKDQQITITQEKSSYNKDKEEEK